MIPVLYRADGSCIGLLTDCTRCYVTQERNGMFEAEVDYPMNREMFRQIEKGCYIMAKPDDISEPQKFRVYKLSKPLYGTVTVSCEHLRYALGGIPAARGVYTGVPSSVIHEMLTSVKSATDFTVWTDIDTIGTVTLDTPNTVGKMLAGTQGSVLDVFGGEYEFDNETIKLHRERGSEKSTEIRYAKNLTGFTCESNIATTYTHVYPFYRDEEEVYVELPGRLITLAKAAELSFERCYMLDLTTYFDTAPTPTQLEAKARAFIAANHLDDISYNYRVSFIPLWQTTEYKNVAALERCALCDTVPIVHDKAGETVKAKIIKTVYDSIAERYVEMELGNATSNFAQTVTQSINQVSDSVKSTRAFMQVAISRATSAITGNSGGYVVLYDSNGDGEPDELLIMDTPSIFTATKVWRWNVAGLGYSRNGYGGPYALAITMQGEIVADFITTGTLNASLIRSGVLLADLIKSGVISDNSGNVTIDMDNGKIKMALSNGYKMQIWTGGITLYDSNNTVLASMFVSTSGNGVVTANRILVGQRDNEKTAIGTDDNGNGYVTTQRLTITNLNLLNENDEEIGSFYRSSGLSVLKTDRIYVDGRLYTANRITVDGIAYNVLSNFSAP